MTSYDDDPRVQADQDGFSVHDFDDDYTVRPVGDHWEIRDGLGTRMLGAVHAAGEWPTAAAALDSLLGGPQLPDGNTTAAADDEDQAGASAPISMEPDPGYGDADLRRLADRCEAGAAELQRAADDPAGVLAERGYHDSADAQEWGRRKQAAADAARRYAADLRAEADTLGEGGRPSPERIAQAEKVATAAECDGILIDGSRLTASAVEHGWHDEVGKQTLRDHQAAADAAVQGSGVFGHVAETINGVQQVPFWQLGGNADTSQDDTDAEQSTAAGNDSGDQGHGGPASAHVGASVGAGEHVVVQGDAVGSGSYTRHGKPSPRRDRTAGAAKTTDTAGASRGATNIGAVTIGSGTVNAGGDIVGQQNVTRQETTAAPTATDDVADGW